MAPARTGEMICTPRPDQRPPSGECCRLRPLAFGHHRIAWCAPAPFMVCGDAHPRVYGMSSQQAKCSVMRGGSGWLVLPADAASDLAPQPLGRPSAQPLLMFGGHEVSGSLPAPASKRSGWWCGLTVLFSLPNQERIYRRPRGRRMREIVQEGYATCSSTEKSAAHDGQNQDRGGGR